MSSSVTVSVRSLVVTLVVALALTAAYLLGSAGGKPAAASTPSRPEVAGTITMTGQGEVTAVPDQLSFRLAVTSTRPDVETAMDASSSILERVLAALDRQGVQRKDTQSNGLSVDPVYRYVDGAPPQITGYRVRQSLSVLVRDLRRGGKAIAATVDAGGNAVRISGIGLRVGDRDALLAEARDAAVESATAKAEQYAAATGQRLGQVLTLREGSRASRPRPVFSAYDRAELSAVADLRTVPIRGGREELAVTVAIVWGLS